MKRLENKVAVSVGGGSAVGSVALRAFLEEGAKVVLVDIDEKYFERTEEIRREYGEERVRTILGACTDQREMDRAMAFAIQAFGRLDILLNIAGFHGSGHIHNIEPRQWNLALDVTCSGAYRASKAAFPYMKAQGNGHIVNFASLGGRGNRSVAISYAASKAACIGLTRAMAMEMAPYGVHMVSFAPGTLDTKEFARIPEKGSTGFKLPPGGIPGMPGYTGPLLYVGQSVIKDRPVADLTEIAYALVYLSSDESDYLTGDCVDMNGGILMQP